VPESDTDSDEEDDPLSDEDESESELGMLFDGASSRDIWQLPARGRGFCLAHLTRFRVLDGESGH
jgi:hypothetical protein